MRKILSLVLSLLLVCAFSATAQVRSISVDASSLEQVHKDALTGLNIDKVGLDRSNRPCARLKIHVNRMAPEDISGIEVKPIGGNVIVMKRQDAVEGNGIIVELTATPSVRFYLHHDRFGDSNPVDLNLEPDKEYRMEAALNELYSIIINTDVADAAITIDGKYEGKTGTDKRLTVPDILSGHHLLQGNWNGRTAEKDIFVSATEIFFRVEFPDVRKLQNFLLFQVSPQNAILEFDGDILPLKDGKYTLFKSEGVYPYKVSAPDYHAEEGLYEFDAKMKQKMEITLRPAYGAVQLTTQIPEGSQIFIDDEYKGMSPITVEKVPSGERTLRIVNGLYKTYTGKIVVQDQETLRPDIRLEPNYKIVTLKVAGNAEIYVNGELKGTGQWSGPLAYGVYQIECRSEKHKPSQRLFELTPELTETNISLDAPEPITGAIKMDSAPSEAQVFLDGKLMGETPLYLPRVIVGEHRIEIMTATQSAEKTVLVKENEMTDINLVLTDIFLKERSFTVKGVTFKMIPVEEGHFFMGATPEQGADAYDDEKPVHQVSLSDYYIGQTEVTQELWEAVMGSNPSYFKGNPENPVERVSWNDIVNDFLPKLNALTGKTFTLPTEAQWEFAARGGNKSKGYKYSGSNDINEVVWYYYNSNNKTHPVAQKFPNELGLYDMSGNVGEWCRDGYGTYSAAAQTEPTGPSAGEKRVLRGGRYDNAAKDCRVSFRISYPDYRNYGIGFRLALSL